MAEAGNPPTLYEWAGGREAFERLIDAFYDRVEGDELISPLFPDGVSEEHRHNVTLWWAEVFGGPADYTRTRGGYPNMLRHHIDKGITEAQRRRWVSLLMDAADDVGLPDDPEFRSAFAAYVEWGTRIARTNSQPGATPPPRAPVPHWGWGEAPPYQP
jgi:hemoglobin